MMALTKMMLMTMTLMTTTWMLTTTILKILQKTTTLMTMMLLTMTLTTETLIRTHRWPIWLVVKCHIRWTWHYNPGGHEPPGPTSVSIATSSAYENQVFK